MYILGFDIGGTKCAVVTAEWNGEDITLLKKESCPTDLSISPEEMIDRLVKMADGILTDKPDAVGISCGGPLDSKKGIIMSPPNLKGWDNVEIVSYLKKIKPFIVLSYHTKGEEIYFEYFQSVVARAVVKGQISNFGVTVK